MGYTNSPLVNYTKISPFKTMNRNHKIDTVTIHCVVGQCAIESLSALFQTKQCSSNYGIGYDGRIGMYVEEKDRSWCSSSVSNDNRAITIEVASDTTEPYAVKPAAYNALIRLLVDICKRNGIKKLVWSTSKNDRVNHLNGCNMTAHRDYHSGKSCPGTYLYEREGQIAAEVNKLLGAVETSSTPAVDTLYHVQIGAFKDCKNAENYLDKAKKAGFEGFVVRGNDNLLRVQIGAFAVEQNAENYLAKARAEGFDGFIVKVSKMMQSAPTQPKIKVGDKVKLDSSAPIYDSTKKFKSWVYSSTLYIRELSGSRAVISTQKTGEVTGAVDVKYLTKI